MQIEGHTSVFSATRGQIFTFGGVQYKHFPTTLSNDLWVTQESEVLRMSAQSTPRLTRVGWSDDSESPRGAADEDEAVDKTLRRQPRSAHLKLKAVAGGIMAMSASRAPAARCYHSSCLTQDEEALIIFGGVTATPSPISIIVEGGAKGSSSFRNNTSTAGGNKSVDDAAFGSFTTSFTSTADVNSEANLPSGPEVRLMLIFHFYHIDEQRWSRVELPCEVDDRECVERSTGTATSFVEFVSTRPVHWHHHTMSVHPEHGSIIISGGVVSSAHRRGDAVRGPSGDIFRDPTTERWVVPPTIIVHVPTRRATEAAERAAANRSGSSKSFGLRRRAAEGEVNWAKPSQLRTLKQWKHARAALITAFSAQPPCGFGHTSLFVKGHMLRLFGVAVVDDENVLDLIAGHGDDGEGLDSTRSGRHQHGAVRLDNNSLNERAQALVRAHDVAVYTKISNKCSLLSEDGLGAEGKRLRWTTLHPVRGVAAPSRAFHSAVVNTKDSMVYVHGGFSGHGESLGDTWQINPVTGTHTMLRTTANAVCRSGHSSVLVGGGRYMVVIGGVESWDSATRKAWGIRDDANTYTNLSIGVLDLHAPTGISSRHVWSVRSVQLCDPDGAQVFDLGSKAVRWPVRSFGTGARRRELLTKICRSKEDELRRDAALREMEEELDEAFVETMLVTRAAKLLGAVSHRPSPGSGGHAQTTMTNNDSMDATSSSIWSQDFARGPKQGGEGQEDAAGKSSDVIRPQRAGPGLGFVEPVGPRAVGGNVLWLQHELVSDRLNNSDLHQVAINMNAADAGKKKKKKRMHWKDLARGDTGNDELYGEQGEGISRNVSRGIAGGGGGGEGKLAGGLFETLQNPANLKKAMQNISTKDLVGLAKSTGSVSAGLLAQVSERLVQTTTALLEKGAELEQQMHGEAPIDPREESGEEEGSDVDDEEEEF